MSTARDLALVALGLHPQEAFTQGDLSLALAGAEAIDLLESGELTLHTGRLIPGTPATTGGGVGAVDAADAVDADAELPLGRRLLNEAAASLVRREPYETVEDWLWRRGRNLAAAYVEDLAQAGPVTQPGRPRHPRRPGRHGRLPAWVVGGVPGGVGGVQGEGAGVANVPAGSPEYRRAEERLASREPVLTALHATLRAADLPPGTGEPTGDAATVLAAVGDAVTALEAQRLRRDVENTAFDNIWRA